VASNSTLFWSPDGHSIGFYSDGAVKRIRRDGGVAEIVCKVLGVAVGGTWSPAGDIVVGNTSGGLVRCPAGGGEATPVTDGGTSGDASAARGIHMFPLFLRDGRRLLYFRVSRANPSGNGLYIADLRLPPDRQSQTRILETGFSARYTVTDTGDERILFVRNRGLWAVGFDSDRLTIEGEPVQVAESVYIFRDGAAFDANARVLVYRGGAPDYQLVWRSRSGDELATIGEPGSFVGVALSPDASRIALTRENKLNRSDQDLWIVDVGRNTTARFTSDPLPESAPAWSADGRAVVFAAGHDDANVVAKPIDGTAQQILLDGATLRPTAVNPLLGTFSASRDGRWLIFNVDTRGPRRSDVWILGLQPRRAATPLIQEDFEQRQAVLSPDQRWVAHVSNESGADEVYVRPMTWPAGAAPTAGAAVPVSRGGGRSPRWRGDSGELFFQSLSGQIMAANISAKTVGEAASLFDAPAALADWDVTADGERFLLARPTVGRALPFTVVLNWMNSQQ
jgi:Tol biopolymer transport system component